MLQSGVILALALPLSLVPYFLLPPHAPPPPMLLDAFPNTDRWVCIARLCAAGMAITGVPLVFIPTRNVVARLVKPWGIEGGGLEGVGRRGREFYVVTAGSWAVCVGFALVGGRVGEFVPLLGVFGAFLLGFLMPGACQWHWSQMSTSTEVLNRFCRPQPSSSSSFSICAARCRSFSR